jgi:hypothetical protein
MQLKYRFLLAKLQLDHVLSPRDPRLQIKAFKTIPKTLDSAYSEVMERIEKSRSGDKALALKIFSWLYHAKRNLSMDELLEALAMCSDAYDDQTEDGFNSDDTNSVESQMSDSVEVCAGGSASELNNQKMKPGDVVECCKSLVIHESNGLVRFSHETVRLFIGKNLKQQLLRQICLAKTCLAYLELPEFHEPCVDMNSLERRMQNFKLCGYAALYWRSHITKEEENSYDTQFLIFEALESQGKRDAKVQLEMYTSSPWLGMESVAHKSLLHVLASKGLPILCRFLLDVNPDGMNTYVPVFPRWN